MTGADRRQRLLRGCSLQHSDRARAPAPVEAFETNGDRAGARSACHDDNGLDDAVTRPADARCPDRDGRADRRRAAGDPRSRAYRGAAEQSAVHVVRDPSGNLNENKLKGAEETPAKPKGKGDN